MLDQLLRNTSFACPEMVREAIMGTHPEVLAENAAHAPRCTLLHTLVTLYTENPGAARKALGKHEAAAVLAAYKTHCEDVRRVAAAVVLAGPDDAALQYLVDAKFRAAVAAKMTGENAAMLAIFALLFKSPCSLMLRGYYEPSDPVECAIDPGEAEPEGWKKLQELDAAVTREYEQFVTMREKQKRHAETVAAAATAPGEPPKKRARTSSSSASAASGSSGGGTIQFDVGAVLPACGSTKDGWKRYGEPATPVRLYVRSATRAQPVLIDGTASVLMTPAPQARVARDLLQLVVGALAATGYGMFSWTLPTLCQLRILYPQTKQLAGAEPVLGKRGPIRELPATGVHEVDVVTANNKADGGDAPPSTWWLVENNPDVTEPGSPPRRVTIMIAYVTRELSPVEDEKKKGAAPAEKLYEIGTAIAVGLLAAEALGGLVSADPNDHMVFLESAFRVSLVGIASIGDTLETAPRLDSPALAALVALMPSMVRTHLERVVAAVLARLRLNPAYEPYAQFVRCRMAQIVDTYFVETD